MEQLHLWVYGRQVEAQSAAGPLFGVDLNSSYVRETHGQTRSGLRICLVAPYSKCAPFGP